MTPDDTNIDRRSLLKKTAAASVAGGLAVGATTGTAAGKPGRPAERDEAEQLLDDHADDLLTMLSERGVLDAGEVAELATDRSASPHAPLRNERGTAFLDSGVGPARLVAVTEVADGTLTVSVEPETGKSYALLDGDGATTVFNPEVGTLDEDDVEVTDSCSQYACPPEADGACYASSAVTYEGDRVATQASCCSYYQCTDP